MIASAATLAAGINLLGPVMSISGNELAIRFGRQRIISTFMAASGLLACVLGYAAGLPWYLVFALMCVHYGLMLGDSAALTSGAIASAPPQVRGATMAIYSFVGFTAAFLAPLVFGVSLDSRAAIRARRRGHRFREHRCIRRVVAARALALPGAHARRGGRAGERRLAGSRSYSEAVRLSGPV